MMFCNTERLFNLKYCFYYHTSDINILVIKMKYLKETAKKKII